MNLLPCFLALLQTQAAVPAPDKVVARFAGQEVHASDIAPVLWEWYSLPTVQEYITNKLVEAEAAKRNVKAEDKEVQDAVQAYVAQVQQSLPAGQDIETALRERNTPRSRLTSAMRVRILVEKIASLDFHPEDYVKTSTIVVTAKSSSAADVKAAIDRATQAYNKLKAGSKWDDVLKVSVDDPRFQKNNGQLDWNGTTAFPDDVQKQLKDLKVGGYTSPVQTPYGIQIFRLEQRGQELKEPELGTLKGRAVARLQQELLQRLRQEAKIELVP